jgi:hypothetical protein
MWNRAELWKEVVVYTEAKRGGAERSYVERSWAEQRRAILPIRIARGKKMLFTISNIAKTRCIKVPTYDAL